MRSDKCLSFYLSNGLVKGHFCRLSDSITQALQNHEYPEKVNALLAEMAAISQCFSMDIKSSSHTTMQLTGTFPVKLALVNSTNCQFFRCCATLNEDSVTQKVNLNALSIPQLFGQDGKLVFTIDFENQYYQTIVELNATTLQECFQHYFIQSMQIPTIVMLCSSVVDNKIESAAMLLQKMPSSNEEDADIWHEASCFAATIKPYELLGSGPAMEKLIELVFGELHPTVSRETILSFRCNCSYEKILGILKNLDSKDSDKSVDSPLEVVCEYCNKKYAIDKKTIGF